MSVNVKCQHHSGPIKKWWKYRNDSQGDGWMDGLTSFQKGLCVQESKQEADSVLKIG